MPVLPWLAAAATTPVRRSPPLPATPRALLRLPASSFPPWSNCAKSGLPPRGPFATAADTPLGGSLPEPEEERDTLLDGALRAARFRDEESRRPGQRWGVHLLCCWLCCCSSFACAADSVGTGSARYLFDELRGMVLLPPPPRRRMQSHNFNSNVLID